MDVPISCDVGDIVTVAVEESALTRQLVWRYGLALSGLVLGLLLGHSLAFPEVLSAVFGIVAMGAGWLIGHRVAGDLKVRVTQ